MTAVGEFRLLSVQPAPAAYLTMRGCWGSALLAIAWALARIGAGFPGAPLSPACCANGCRAPDRLSASTT